MLSSKFLSLLTVAAAPVAQKFPSGQFFIANIKSELVLEADVGSSNSDVLVALTEREAGNSAQLWTYAENRGFLIHEGTRIVLEVPRTDGEVNYGTRLQIAAVNGGSDEARLNQLWDYDAGAQHLFTLADKSACVAGNSSSVYAVVDDCDPHDNDSQRWRFISV